ncbi:MAG: hypothetical protein ACTSU7_01725, partial [Candidatus Heimdallarchaeaceae archaeon]
EIPSNPTIQDLRQQISILKQRLTDSSTTVDQSKAIKNTIFAINSVINIAKGDITNETTINPTEIVNSANNLVDLSEEDKEEIEEAGKNEEGFLATIKRTFKGSGWKKFVGSIGKRFASNLAISSIASGTVALLGPVGATLVGGAMVVMGGITLHQGFKKLKAEAKAQGRTIKDLWADKEFRKGLIAGTLTTGVGRLTTIGMSSIIPGVGGILGSALSAMGTAAIGTTLESGVEFVAEKGFQAKQREFLDKLSSNYNLKKYSDMNRRKYLMDGDEYEGQKVIDVQRIIANLKDAEILSNNTEAKFAKKIAVATLLELYKYTGDEKYKNIEYGTDTNKQQIDLTKIGLKETQDSTSEYPMLEFEPPIDAYIDTINVKQLSSLLEDGWSRVEQKDIASIGMKIIENFSGLEAAEIDRIVSDEKRIYFEKLNFMSGFRMASTVVNGLTAITAGGIAFGKGVSAFAEQKNVNTSSTQELQDEINNTKNEIQDSDAKIEVLQNEAGEKVYKIDLDNDDTVDMYRTEGGEMIATSVVGAEKVFELQNGFTDAEITTQIIPNATTGIAATLVNASGEVVAVSVNDYNGNWSSMTISELETTLSATLSNGDAVNLNIAQIQPNGRATIKIGDMSYDTSLGFLNNIPATEGIEGLSNAGAIRIHQGDSMPVLLRNALASAMEHNPTLKTAYQQDPYIMERTLYKGNYLENDAAIRNEANLTNPLQVDNNNGMFEFAKSPTVMSMLKNLNAGQEVILPPGTEGSAGTPGYKLSFNNSLENISTKLGKISPIEVSNTPKVNDLTGLAAVAGLGIATLLDREPHVMTRKAIITQGTVPPPTGSSTTTPSNDNTKQSATTFNQTTNPPIRKSEILPNQIQEPVQDSKEEKPTTSQILLNTIDELEGRGINDGEIRLDIIRFNKEFHSTLFPDDKNKQQQLQGILNAMTVLYSNTSIQIKSILPLLLNTLDENFPKDISQKYVNELLTHITSLSEPLEEKSPQP